MAKQYKTSNDFRLVNQVYLSSKNSNVDIDYGPYEGYTTDGIITLLKDTIQIGKTVGIIEEGKVVEYWAQPKDPKKEVSSYADLELVKKSPSIGDLGLSTVFKFKGTKENLYDVSLLTVTDCSVGDVWHIKANNSEYVCTEVDTEGKKVSWEELGTSVDLSSYLTSEDITAGDSSGCINVDGTSVKITGLKSAAYAETSVFATSAQGALADSALQPGDIDVISDSEIDDIFDDTTSSTNATE